MRKTLSVLLIALTAVLLVVSCSQGPESETGLVSFNLGKAKSVTSTSTDIDVSSLKWYISAHRNDSGFWKEGATSDSCNLSKISGVDWQEKFNTADYVFTKSLDFDSSMTFSAGSWFMSIQGRTTAGELVYQSPAKTVVVEANKEKPVSFEVENMVGEGKVVLKNITFTFPNTNYNGSNLTLLTTVTDLRGDSVFSTDTNASVSGDTVTFYSTELEKELGNGLYTFTFLISVGPDDVATSNISVMVYNGYTVTIEGDLNSLSESGTVVVKQNVAVYYNGTSDVFVTADKLQEAFDNVAEGGTIRLLATVAPTETIDLDSGRNYTLDLRYYSINSTATPAFAITDSTFVTVLGGIDSKITSNGVVVDIDGCGITLQSGSIETTSDTAPAIDCKEGTVEINGGSVEAKKVAIAVSGGNSEVKLNGGSIKAAPDGKAIEAKTNEEGTPKVSVAGTKVEAGAKDLSEASVTIDEKASSDALDSFAVAKIGNKYYVSLADAIKAVKNGETIVMQKSVDDAHGISVSEGKNFTVDFNKTTYTCTQNPAGSAGTENQVFQLLKDSTIVFKNGTITVPESNKTDKIFRFIIQNYASLTLDHMVIDGSNLAYAVGGKENCYSVSYNCGTSNITGTTIYGPDCGFAFDVYDSPSYEGKPTVTVKGDSKITGKIEVSGGDLVIEGGAFTDLASVIPYVADGKTIKLAKDIELTSTIEVEKNITLDLNGHSVTGKDVRAIQVKEGTMLVTGQGTISSKKTSTLNPESSVIRVGDNENKAATLTVDKDVTVSTTACYAISVFNKVLNNEEDKDVTLVVKGKVSSDNRPAISGVGNTDNGKTHITIESTAEVTTTNENAIYFPCRGTLAIAGKVTGNGGIELKAGEGTVSVGETACIEATALETKIHSNGNGCSTSGYAIAVVENSGYYGNAKVTVEGGKVIGKMDIIIDNVVDTNKKGSIIVKGGSFTDLVSAVNYAKENATIKLAADVSLSEELVIDKKITLDGNNKNTLTSDLTGKAGILVQCPGVTIQNLTVDGPNTNPSGWDEGEYGIKVWYVTTDGNRDKYVTLKNVTVTGSNAGILVNGNVVVTGTLNISGNEFGGIEISKSGSNTGVVGKLTLSPGADITCLQEKANSPAMWIDKFGEGKHYGTIEEALSYDEREITLYKYPISTTDKNQMYLFLDETVVPSN